MQAILKKKLWAYIVNNNPELMLSLQEGSVTKYLNTKVSEVMPVAEQFLAEGKPLYIVEELCLDAMTEELKPSRYQYIRSVLEDEFPQEYEQMMGDGTLTYEVINLIEACKNIFDEFDFNSKNEESRLLRYAIIGQVHDYLL